MNRYAQIALDQHRRSRPLEHALLDDPIRFFTEIGEAIQTDVTNLRDEILGPPQPGETIEDYRLRSQQALTTAEEVVLTDHYLFRPEADEETDDFTDDPILVGYYRNLAEINETIRTAH